MWRSAGDQENAAVNRIQEILEQIQECSINNRETSSHYKNLEEVLVEYARIRGKKRQEHRVNARRFTICRLISGTNGSRAIE